MPLVLNDNHRSCFHFLHPFPHTSQQFIDCSRKFILDPDPGKAGLDKCHWADLHLTLSHMNIYFLYHQSRQSSIIGNTPVYFVRPYIHIMKWSTCSFTAPRINLYLCIVQPLQLSTPGSRCSPVFQTVKLLAATGRMWGLVTTRAFSWL